MPFCNHCGEILAPGTVTCPTCRGDPNASTSNTLSDAAAVHVKLEEMGAGGTGGGTPPGSAQMGGGVRTTEMGGGVRTSGTGGGVRTSEMGGGVRTAETGGGVRPMVAVEPEPADDGLPEKPEFNPASSGLIGAPSSTEAESRSISSGAKSLIPGPNIDSTPIRLSVTPEVPDEDSPVRELPAQVGKSWERPASQADVIEEFLQSDVSLDEEQRKIKHLLQRAAEHVERGRTYKALKNKTQARQSYTRAMQYYKKVVDMDPHNLEARKMNQECMYQMSR